MPISGSSDIYHPSLDVRVIRIAGRLGSAGRSPGLLSDSVSPSSVFFGAGLAFDTSLNVGGGDFGTSFGCGIAFGFGFPAGGCSSSSGSSSLSVSRS